MKKIGRALGLFIILSLISSCASMLEKEMAFTEGDLLGMIYDYDSQPCSNALIILDDVEGPRTDINGRFLIYSLSRGTHTIKVEKEGFEKLSYTFQYLNKGQVVYLKVISLNQLLRKVEENLDQRNYPKSLQFIERAELIKSDDPVLTYLKAIYSLKTGDPESALKLLDLLLKMDYHDKSIYLSIIDIYEKELNEIVNALEYIKRYLDRGSDPEMEKRYGRLQKELEAMDEE